jgi:XTP/dITP diphosphohydrolase
MTFSLILATSNLGKIREFQSFLDGWEILPKPPEIDIQETGKTFQANAQLKALGVAKETGKWALGEDSGLEVFSLDGQPGIYSARWGKSDEDRIKRLLDKMGQIKSRQARFVSSIVLASPTEILCQVEGVCEGEILTEPRGSGGFGYDPIFYYPPLGLTMAEMTLEQKQEISHRGKALRALLPKLTELTQSI